MCCRFQMFFRRLQDHVRCQLFLWYSGTSTSHAEEGVHIGLPESHCHVFKTLFIFLLHFADTSGQRRIIRTLFAWPLFQRLSRAVTTSDRGDTCLCPETRFIDLFHLRLLSSSWWEWPWILPRCRLQRFECFWVQCFLSQPRVPRNVSHSQSCQEHHERKQVEKQGVSYSLKPRRRVQKSHGYGRIPVC